MTLHSTPSFMPRPIRGIVRTCFEWKWLNATRDARFVKVSCATGFVVFLDALPRNGNARKGKTPDSHRKLHNTRTETKFKTITASHYCLLKRSTVLFKLNKDSILSDRKSTRL